MLLLCLLDRLIMLWVIAVIGRVILSFFPIAPDSGMSSVYGVLYTVTEPVLAPVRNLIPALGPIDISPMLVIFAANIVQSFLC